MLENDAKMLRNEAKMLQNVAKMLQNATVNLFKLLNCGRGQLAVSQLAKKSSVSLATDE